MCELLGISANRECDIRLSFRDWVHHAQDNPHGYGFAWWEKDQLRIYKRPQGLFEDWEQAAKEMTRARSRLFVAHVRRASSLSEARQALENTHRFRATLSHRDLVFAHNGTLCGFRRALPLRHRQPEGTTDSEHAFLWMLEQLAEVPEDEFSDELREYASKVERLGDFNFLLSDGHSLWAYSSGRLHFLEREPPYQGRHLRLRSVGEDHDLAEVKVPGERAVIVATRPLTEGESWQRLPAGELLVIRDGRVAQRLS